MRRSFVQSLALSLTLAIAGRAMGADVRHEFMAAVQRVRLHQPEPPDSPALQAYPIHDYLVAARLRRDLGMQAGEALDATIEAFLTQRAGLPVARGLRHDWLASLASRRRWDWFLPRSTDTTDPQLLCDRLAGRLTTGDTNGLAADALARWSLPQRQPGECDAVFAWLRAQNLLTPALAESRARAALAADNPRLARESAADLPAALAAPLLQWAQLLEAPRAALEILAADPARPAEAQALAAGFDRLSRIDSAAAAAVLPRLLGRQEMTPAAQMSLRRAAALGAAYDHAPAALAAFNGVSVDADDVAGQEWRVRAALWAGEYAVALGWLEQMPASLGGQTRWRYWRARAVQATAGNDAAAPLFAELAGLRDYYGYLAADRLQQNYRLNAEASPDDAGAQEALAARPALIRAHALFDCDLVDDAGAEWNTVFGAATASTKVQGAHLAARWGWYAQSITDMAQAAAWDDLRLRYPRPYAAAVQTAAAMAHLPVEWILAVMRQESLFRADAVSRADARGLMQMQIPTAIAVARRWHLAVPGPDGLFDPMVAVPLGAAHLRDLLDRHDEQLVLSLAAYNAGAGPVARWLPAHATDAEVWIENIPYGETRAYVQHILEHIVAFAWVRDAPLPRLGTLLKTVEPAPPGPPSATKP
jgi:soluble lytic murein transglycosylase